MTSNAGGSGANEFLKDEYDKSIDLIKYYDERHIELLKFASALSAGVPTVVFGFYGLSANAEIYIWDFACFIGLITSIGLLSIFAAMVRNRVYFVFPARQANVIRGALFPTRAETSAVNQMYTTPDVPMVDWVSTQSLQLLFVALQTALFCGLTVFAWNKAKITLIGYGAEFAIAFLVFLAMVIIAAGYLNAQSKRRPNDVLHAKFQPKPRHQVSQDPRQQFSMEEFFADLHEAEQRDFEHLLHRAGVTFTDPGLVIFSVHDSK